jgi:molybdate/tungstate transport system substrate-binding protein
MKRVLSLMTVIGAVVLVLALTPGCAEEEAKTLTIYHAGSLAVPLEQLEADFEADHPNVDVLLESGGSAAMISKAITRQEAGETPPDILASADYTLIPNRLYEPGYADSTIIFAKNQMVLCYRDGAPFAEDIESGDRTWYDVLRYEDVTWGHSNPDDDPCGYRSLMVFQLAQDFYFDDAETFASTPDPVADGLYDACVPGTDEERGRVTEGRQTVRSKSVDLIYLLQSGDLDYALEYSSVAVQHELGYIELDDAINLSAVGTIGDSGVTYAEFYSRASVPLQKAPGEYSTMEGAAIVYGITIMKDAPEAELAAEFIAFLLSDTGKQVFEVENGQPFVSPPKSDYPARLPSLLEHLVVPL